MEPRIVNLSEKKLVGKSLRMTLSADKTMELWKSFMPERKSIENVVEAKFYSMQVYDENQDYINFNDETGFTKWAAVEVKDNKTVPKGMEAYTLKGGMYAVFVHKGPASEFFNTSRYIFEEWLPGSEYTLDQREHFEVLGEKYNPSSPDSEEEVWVPIKKK